MRRIIGFLAALICCGSIMSAQAADAVTPTPAPVLPPPAQWSIVPQKSHLRFVAMNNGAPVEGSFKAFGGTIVFDPKQPDKSHFTIEVDMSSVAASNDELPATLVKPDWFAVAAFPKAICRSTLIHDIPGTDGFYADAVLTLRGKEVPVTVNFTVDMADGKNVVATGNITLRRNDFGIGQGEWTQTDPLRNEVAVKFRVAAVKGL